MVPSLGVQYTGQGVIGADQANTYVQTATNFAQLRTFTGLNGMMVVVQGGVTQSDGSQGVFYYVSTGSYIDNGSSVIVPNGALQGAWLLLPPGSQSAGNFATLAVSGNATIGGTLGVTGVATFGANIVMSGTGSISPPIGTTAQRGTPGLGAIRYNSTLGYLETLSATGWQSVLNLLGANAVGLPGGRLTLSSGIPVMTANVASAVGILYTPNVSNQIPQWTGAGWTVNTFAEIYQAFSDTTQSPAAAVAGSVYDLFVWYNSGVATLSRGPVWSSLTTRSAGTAIARVQGILVNSNDIANGPRAGYGLYVGSIITDAAGATVTFNPYPGAASGGPNLGAWIGLWNQYNRVNVLSQAQDSKASWTYGTATWRPADNSANNRATIVLGVAEDFIQAVYNVSVLTQGGIGLGLNSITSPSIGSSFSSGGSIGAPSVSQAFQPAIGLTYIQALEYNVSATGTYYGTTNGALSMSLQLQSRY